MLKPEAAFSFCENIPAILRPSLLSKLIVEVLVIIKLPEPCCNSTG
jgi:hypothetical protein